MSALFRRPLQAAVVVASMSLGSCGQASTPTAPAPLPAPLATPTPPPMIVTILDGTVRKTGGIEDATHLFTMTSAGQVEARLLSFAPAESRLDITLCQGNIEVLHTCTAVATGLETDIVRSVFQAGTNTVFVAKRRGDAFRDDSVYRLELKHAP